MIKRRQAEEAKRKEEVEKRELTRDNSGHSNRNTNSVGASYGRFIATAYTAGPESTGKSPGDADYGITTSGRHVRENHTIACPKSIALGTRLEIEGLGVRTCDDRGGAITEGRLDIYFERLSDAQEFGRRMVRARILK